MPPDLFLWVLLGVLVLLMVFSSRNVKKQRASQQEKQDQAIQVGKSVRTFSGFYGTIVDIDGDAITLATASGVEMIWHRQAIQMEATPPFSTEEEEAGSEDGQPSMEIAAPLDETTNSPNQKRDSEK